MVTTRRATRVTASPRPAKRFKSVVAESTEQTVAEQSPAKKKRNANGRAKEEPKPADYRPRVSSPWKVGAHVSAAGGVENAVQNAADVG